MKHLLLTTIAAVLLVGCGTTKQLTSTAAAKSVAEPPFAKLPEISNHDVINEGNIEDVKQHLAASVAVNARIDYRPKSFGSPTVKRELFPESRIPPRPDANELGGITVNVVGWRF
jgi:hypothetical protein